jgi:HEAT repeat protein
MTMRNHPAHWPRLGLAAALSALLALPGCAWDQSPGASLASGLGLAVQSPEELAADAFNVSDPDARRRSVIAIANGPHGDKKPYLRLYRKLLTDPDPTVQAACARALGMHGKVKDAQKLATLLDSDNTFVQWEAAKALQRIHNPAVADALSDTVQNADDADVRMAAAHALGQYPQPAVVDTLVSALRDPNYGVVQQARKALRTLTGHDGPASATHWVSWVENHRDSLFQDQKRYTYQPYQGAPGWLDRAVFWQEPEPAQRSPRGLEVADQPDEPTTPADNG